MSRLTQAWAIRSSLIGSQDPKAVGEVLHRLPAALRRMGLVRSLEWLAQGKHSALGEQLHQQVSAELGLPFAIKDAVAHLEQCPRHELFERHREVSELFDALALVQRVKEEA